MVTAYVYVCADRDIVCGSRPELWCPGCPLRATEDRKQIIYALERQACALEGQANRLAEQHDYGAEFPAEDARRLRAAIKLLGGT